MNSLETIIELRKTLTSMNEALTPYSDFYQHQRYYESLIHYKKILNTHLARLNQELDMAIEKSYRIKTNLK